MSYANQKRQIYVVRERDFRKLNILHETEAVGKQCSDDSDEQLEDQFSQEWPLKVASKV